jgi:hypothetical protein
MQTAMSRAMIGKVVGQARKITIFRVTGGVRAYREISPIFNKICSHLQAWFLSKNGMLNKNPCLTAPCIHPVQSLPAT